ncbi:L-lactate dehydrogenase [Dichanthelium oligosanthes]|uniref:L-lactate dehydrogenase n=1 Tax=Dichanthelium oligosanthes TaxID=888268 RepID=A0A1E5W9B7_9POAL|nr:L-lactate dehydrogenase [Dichanthelium oligosanthes]
METSSSLSELGFDADGASSGGFFRPVAADGPCSPPPTHRRRLTKVSVIGAGNHAEAFLPRTRLVSDTDIAVTRGSDLAIVTAGARQIPGEMRLNLLRRNVALFRKIVPALAEHSLDATPLIVSNLDSSSFRFLLAEHLDVNAQDVQVSWPDVFLSLPARLGRGGGAVVTAFPPVVCVRWTPPPPGWYKLNFDGSVCRDESGRASIGGVIRDCTGRLVAAFAERTDHAPIGVVEALALIRGLHLAAEQCCFIYRLLVEGDDLMLVQLLRGESRHTRRRISHDMEGKILELLGRFPGGCVVQHIYREGNQVADTLCREAYLSPGVWINRSILPFHIYEKVEDDRHGVAHARIL